MRKPRRAQGNWASPQKAKVRPYPVVRNVCAYAVSGWESVSRLEPERHLLLSPSFSWQPRWGAGGKLPTALQLPGGVGALCSLLHNRQLSIREPANAVSTQNQCTSTTSGPGHRLPEPAWHSCERAGAGLGKVRPGRGAPTRRDPGAPARGSPAHTRGPRRSWAGPGAWGSCLLGCDCGGTLALPSPGLKGGSESTKEPRAVTGGRGAFRNDLLSSPRFEGMFWIYFLFNFCGGKHDLPTYTVPQ